MPFALANFFWASSEYADDDDFPLSVVLEDEEFELATGWLRGFPELKKKNYCNK